MRQPGVISKTDKEFRILRYGKCRVAEAVFGHWKIKVVCWRSKCTGPWIMDDLAHLSVYGPKNLPHKKDARKWSL